MEYLLKVSFVTVIFYFIYKVFLQRDTFFESNRGFLLLGLVSSFTIPFLVIPIYIEYTPTLISNYSFSDPIVVEKTAEPFNILDYLPIAYLLGVLFFSVRFSIQFVSLFILIFKNKRDKQRGFTFIKVNTKVSPFSFFNWIVYNPNQFTETELDQIITHEKIHVKQYHSIDILLTQLSCIVLWFNPFIWLYNKSVKQNLEFIADQNAQHKFSCKKSYQTTLLKTSIPSHQMVLSNNFYNSLIKKRIVMLHKSKSRKINLTKYLFVIPLLAIFLMSFNTENVYVEKPVLNSDNNPDTTQASTTKKENNIESPIVNLEKPPSIAQEAQTKNNIEKFLIYNSFTDAKLEAFKIELKSKGFDFNLKELERNRDNLITNIFFSISKNGANGNYRIASPSPIKTIITKYFEDKNKFSFYTLNFHEDQKRNTDYQDIVEITIDKHTTLASIENKRKLLLEKYGLNSNLEIIEKNSKNEIIKYSFQIGKQRVRTYADRPYIFKYNPKDNKVTHYPINKNGDLTKHYAIIKSDYSDKILKSYVKSQKEAGITLKFTNVKRNEKSEIIAINVNAKSKYGHVNYNQDTGAPITSFAISYYGKGNGLGINPGKIIGLTNKNTLTTKDFKKDPNIIEKLIKESKDKQPLYVLDDKIITKKALKLIDEHKIGAISILKDESSIKKYGDKAKHGVVIISTKKKKNDKIFIKGLDNDNPPLYIIDDKEAKKEDFEQLSPYEIESIHVLKDESTIKKYGDKGKNGVVEITTKKE